MSDDKNPTRVRVLADGETREWSVLLPTGCWSAPTRPERLFVLVEPSNLILIDAAVVTSAKETAERFEGPDFRRVVLRRDDARWLLDVLPAALDHANRYEPGEVSRAFHEDRHPLSVLTLARQLARELRDVLTDEELPEEKLREQTRHENDILAQLCDVLGVEPVDGMGLTSDLYRHDGGLEK